MSAPAQESIAAECGRTFQGIRGNRTCMRPAGHAGPCNSHPRVIGPTVFGVEVADDLPSGWEAEGVIVLVRAVDADGRRRTTQIEGGDIMLWEAVGMCETATRSFATRLDLVGDVR